MMRTLPLLALTPLALLAGCAGDMPRPVAAIAPPPAIAAPSLQVMGADARLLIAQLGTPALDQREGPARKLQFRGATCVLDAYLYPQAGAPARVTWIDTRSPQGTDVDRATCIAALARR